MKKSPRIIARSAFQTLSGGKIDVLNRMIEDLGRMEKVAKKTRLSRILKGAGLNSADRIALLDKAVSVLGVGSESQALLRVLVGHGQWAGLPQVIQQLKALRQAKFRVVEAEAVSVRPLSAAQKSRAEKALSQISGMEILLKESLDAGLLGGMVLRMQDTRIDASLLGKIKRLRKLIAS